MAERVGFEPTCRLPDKLISSQPRYDHFDTAPGRRGDYSIPVVFWQEVPLFSQNLSDIISGTFCPALSRRIRSGAGQNDRMIQEGSR